MEPAYRVLWRDTLTVALCWTGLGVAMGSATEPPASSQLMAGSFTTSGSSAYAQADPGRVAPLHAASQ